MQFFSDNHEVPEMAQFHCVNTTLWQWSRAQS
jgi:hypothetical protein